jgi:CheY-like chemotaxis protein
MKEKIHILIVDDDTFFLDMYSMRFKTAGYEVTTASNGKNALEKLQTIIPDIILLDLTMPVMDGFETLKQMQKEDRLKKIKVIMLTNKGEPEDIALCDKYGAKGYIIKANSTPTEVVERVNTFL